MNGHEEDDRAAKRARLDLDSDAEDNERLELERQAKEEMMAAKRPTDLYLDTVSRPMLDFDFTRQCSITLSDQNVYSCLVCGKYYQGRGKSTAAYAHALNDEHHVFVNLDTLKVYVLPDLYEVTDPSLGDIKYLLSPTFTPALLKKLDAALEPCHDLQRNPYYAGFIGLNNIKHNAYMNVVLQSLLHIPSLRDYLVMRSQRPKDNSRSVFEREGKSELVQRLAMLYRKCWNPRLFKAQVSPHELYQEVSVASAKRFRVTEPADPLDFLAWLLNSVHRDLGGSKKRNSSVIYAAFQGELRSEEQQVVVKQEGTATEKPSFDISRDSKTTVSPFLFLTLDLPPRPVFESAVEKNIIPQVALSAILAKYDGVTTQEYAGQLKRYKLTKLPPYLIFHIKRFTSNNFVEERNPTIVNYPLKGIDMREYVDDPATAGSTIYDLVANVTVDSTAETAREDSAWKAHVHTRRGAEHETDERWYQMQDLIVEEINRQMVGLGETYLQIWERRTEAPVELRVQNALPPEKIKTTRAIVAAAADKSEAKGPQQVVKSQVGVKMGKVRVEKGDAQGFSL